MAVTQAQLTQIYLAYFGRPPDFDGLTYYTSQPNLSIWDVAAAFSNSPESQALYGTSTGATQITAAQINAIYLNLFNRPAEIAGLTYWEQQVATGKLTAGGVAMAILLGAQGTDATTVQNKLQVSTAFDAALNAGGASAVIGYSGIAAAASARQFLAGVDSTTTSLTTATAGVGAAVASAVGVGGVAGQTLTLTTGVDNLAPTSNTVINAFQAATGFSTGDTLSAADVIKGSGTGNVLNITNTGVNTDATAAAQISGIQTVNIRNSAPTGTASTLDASKISGLTAVNSNVGTGDIIVTNLASGASAGIIGNGTVANGALTAGYVASATAATLNLSGGVNQTALTVTTINGSGITSTTVNSTGAANKLGGLTLAATDTALTINATTNLTTGAITGAALKTVTVTGAAAQVNLSGAALPASVTTVNASGMTAGGVKVTNANAAMQFTGGASNNFFATNSIVLNTTGTVGSVNAGTGTGNTLDVSNSTDVANATLGALYKGFNTLQVESGVAQDASLLAANNTFTAAVVNGVGAAAVTSLTNLASGVGVTIGNSANATAGAASTIDYQTAGSLTLAIKGATTVGQIDTLNVTVNDSVAASAAAGSSTVKLGALTASGIENVAFHVTNAGDTVNISSLANMGAATSVKFDGAGAASLTTGAVTPVVNSTIDASGLSGKFTLDASLATTNAVAIKGSIGANTITLQNTAVSGDVVDLSANTKGGSTIYTGTLSTALTGNATITLGTHAAADTIFVTDGAFVDGGTGAFTMVNGFSLGSTAATSDILTFSAAGGAESITTAGAFTAVNTGVANLTATSASGLITFAGSALSTATAAQLIGAAESVLAGTIDKIGAFVLGGNTYVVDIGHVTTTAAAAHVVELVGVSASSIGTAAGAGVVHIA